MKRLTSACATWEPTSIAMPTDARPTVLRERASASGVPRFDLEEWRRRFGLVAGVTGRGDRPGLGFDLAFRQGEATEAPRARWEALRTAEPGFDGFIRGAQVHGTRVEWHQQPGDGWTAIQETDGHATSLRGTLLAVTVADCIPVYLVAPSSGAVALLHAGWRGTAGGILEQGVSRLRERSGAALGEIVMHCGVGICGECYEVGSEVLEAFGLRGDGRGPWKLDLRERLVEQGEQLGLSEITTSAWCTSHHRPLFHSHRGSGGSDGRMAAFLGHPAG